MSYNGDSNIDKEIVSNKQLLEKLNYMIYLLEEQHNEKTNHIMEELVLYIFLGIFIIFVLGLAKMESPDAKIKHSIIFEVFFTI